MRVLLPFLSDGHLFLRGQDRVPSLRGPPLGLGELMVGEDGGMSCPGFLGYERASSVPVGGDTRGPKIL